MENGVMRDVHVTYQRALGVHAIDHSTADHSNCDVILGMH